MSNCNCSSPVCREKGCQGTPQGTRAILTITPELRGTVPVYVSRSEFDALRRELDELRQELRKALFDRDRQSRCTQ